jgi:hypothetical protein
MSSPAESDLDWLDFEPDEALETRYPVGEDGPVDKNLITDATVKKCRVLATIRCIEYGTTLEAPGLPVPAMLLVTSFTFHPFESRVIRADVELSFSAGSIALLQPESIYDSETIEIIHKKLSGAFRMGYPPAGLDIAGERESEMEKKYELRILGSGSNTQSAIWTLEENPRDKKGIHLNFISVVVLKAQGDIEMDIKIQGKLGLTLKNVLGIRRITTGKRKRFDGNTLLGIRPADLHIHEDFFKANVKA